MFLPIMSSHFRSDPLAVYCFCPTLLRHDSCYDAGVYNDYIPPQLELFWLMLADHIIVKDGFYFLRHR